MFSLMQLAGSPGCLLRIEVMGGIMNTLTNIKRCLLQGTGADPPHPTNLCPTCTQRGLAQDAVQCPLLGRGCISPLPFLLLPESRPWRTVPSVGFPTQSGRDLPSVKQKAFGAESHTLVLWGFSSFVEI